MVKKIVFALLSSFVVFANAESEILPFKDDTTPNESSFVNDSLIPALNNLGDEPERPPTISERAKLSDGLLEQRVRRESATTSNPFVITPHRPNYFLPLAYTHDPNSRNQSEDSLSEESLDSLEFKFQISLKFPVSTNVLNTNTSLWFAYTQQAYWQAYNSEISAPFRDTNHEPEVFLLYQVKEAGGFTPKYVSFGINHQSNGRVEPFSRSWNRIFAEFLFEHENTVLSIKPWYRLPESREDDDNPNIEKYLGYGELNLVHVIDDYSIDLMLRNNLRTDNKGAIQLGFTFPAWGKIRGYVQYFNGYGQSLLDYNNKTQSLGIGVTLTDWL
ncbi:phospholipase A [Marinomonas sp. 15G1-11]|uniref:Phospholipase A1 n=1 Tax=Marinomonas phaeophyticola TaxID=3004091 RepID=A0ABT4JXX6_9GAMM|nr:phospholipase A [Marinomonas sp. 15G1-11]MCZ2723184.1 phospholipase A [Marinomonas sp. 15G1-11]